MDIEMSTITILPVMLDNNNNDADNEGGRNKNPEDHQDDVENNNNASARSSAFSTVSSKAARNALKIEIPNKINMQPNAAETIVQIDGSSNNPDNPNANINSGAMGLGSASSSSSAGPEPTRDKWTRIEIRNALLKFIGAMGNDGTIYSAMDPNSKFLLGWMFLNATLLSYIAVFLPIRIAFEDEMGCNLTLVQFDMFVDLFFIADVILNFFTAFPQYGRYEFDRKKIFKKYVRGFFLFDLIVSIPTMWIQFFMGNLCGSNSHLLIVPRMLRLVRLFRVIRVVKLFNLSLFSRRGSNELIVQLVKLAVSVFFVMHLSGCGFWLVRSFDDGIDQWSIDHGVDGSWGDKYVVSLYYAGMTLTTVGYGDIHAENTADRVYSTCIMILGAGIFAMIISSISALVSRVNMKKKKCQQKIDTVREFIDFHDVPVDIAQRMEDFFYFNHQADDWNANLELIYELPPLLRSDVCGHLACKIIGTCEILSKANQVYKAEAFLRMRPMRFAPRDVIIRLGQESMALFILYKGEVTLNYEDGSMVTKKSGEIFGESFVVLQDEKFCLSHFSAVATQLCEIYLLDKTDIEEMNGFCPEVMVALKELAKAREKDRTCSSACSTARHSMVMWDNTTAAGVPNSLLNVRNVSPSPSSASGRHVHSSSSNNNSSNHLANSSSPMLAGGATPKTVATMKAMLRRNTLRLPTPSSADARALDHDSLVAALIARPQAVHASTHRSSASSEQLAGYNDINTTSRMASPIDEDHKMVTSSQAFGGGDGNSKTSSRNANINNDRHNNDNNNNNNNNNNNEIYHGDPDNEDQRPRSRQHSSDSKASSASYQQYPLSSVPFDDVTSSVRNSSSALPSPTSPAMRIVLCDNPATNNNRVSPDMCRVPNDELLTLDGNDVLGKQLSSTSSSHLMKKRRPSIGNLAALDTVHVNGSATATTAATTITPSNIAQIDEDEGPTSPKAQNPSEPRDLPFSSPVVCIKLSETEVAMMRRDICELGRAFRTIKLVELIENAKVLHQLMSRAGGMASRANEMLVAAKTAEEAVTRLDRLFQSKDQHRTVSI